MKRNLMFAFLALAIISCNDDFMKRYPLDQLNEGNFWMSSTDLETYANQFYPLLDYLSYDQMSDNEGPVDVSSVNFIWNQYTVPSSGGGWDFTQIRSCNYFLTHYQTAKGDQGAINTYVGEIKFFRAWLYHAMIKRFGDVPWIDKDLQVNSPELYGPRDSRKLVMDSVIADLDYAIAKLPESSSEGRLTKYAALALKVRACLYEGTFRKYHNLGDHAQMLGLAVSAAVSIINSGKFVLYQTGNPNVDYHNLFVQHDYTGNTEAIMFKAYITNLLMNGRNGGLEAGMASGFTKDFVETYLCTDGKPISISSLYIGDAQYMDEFKNRDPRMVQSINTPNYPWVINGIDTTYQSCPIFDNQTIWTGYKMIKMYSPLFQDSQYNQSTLEDLIFRYGEVLINYAEAEAELGNCTQDILDKSVNLLRDRVGMPHLLVDVGFTDPNWPIWDTDPSAVPVTPLINEIRRERRIELVFEGFRFDDIMRWKAGKLLENPKTQLGARNPATGNYQALYPGQAARQWNDKLYFYPLPIQELSLNPALTQNPGW